MPQEPLPELTKEQQDLWDEILKVRKNLEDISKLEPKIFRIELSVVNPVTLRLSPNHKRAVALLHKLGSLLEKAHQDPAFSDNSFVQRMQPQVRAMKMF